LVLILDKLVELLSQLLKLFGPFNIAAFSQNLLHELNIETLFPVCIIHAVELVRVRYKPIALDLLHVQQRAILNLLSRVLGLEVLDFRPGRTVLVFSGKRFQLS
jgi:hypothetical protein